jgi:hypothetical protein
MRLRVAGVIGTALLVGLSAQAAAGSAAAEDLCPIKNAAGTAVGEPVDPPIALQAEPGSASQVINFGADRKPESKVFHVTAASGEDTLPKDLEKRLELVADPIVRTGEKTDSVSFPEPEFSLVKPSGNRKRLSFRVCLAPPSDLPAGKYVGTIALEGPPGVDSATVTITANAKDGQGFWIAAVATAVLAFLVLFYKGAGDTRATRMTAAAALPDESDDEKAAKAKKEDEALSWARAAWRCLIDPSWYAPTLAAIGATFGVLWAAYTDNPAWGESGLLTSAIALIGTGLAAVGAKAIFTPAGKT